MGFFDSLFDAGITYAAQQQGVKDLKDYGKTIRTEYGGLADKAVAGTTFKPFTVSTGLSTTTTDPSGGYNIALSPDQQRYQAGLFGGAEQMLGSATGSLQSREQDVFNRLQAMMSPAQERERLELEQRMMGQGRGGVRTAAYGGTPEQLALAKAQEEQRAMSSVQAMEQARAQQAQEANIGQGLFQMGYLPTQQAMASLAPATNISDLIASLQKTGTQSSTGLLQSGLEGDITARTAAAAQEQQMFSDIIKSLTSTTNTETGVQGQGNAILDFLKEYNPWK
jgi:hypothetical protein